ncbi:hypothetical protein ACQEVZ_27610 [Dactylosporangium sp. CA-152071]|uniref:hypothetical protein n=1 Tax=Dactylosporangium sp. CA-152071 TaxID=3239933 RepID=UPI003D91D46F
MTLDLVFAPDGPAERLDRNSYRLFARDGHYSLPAVAVQVQDGRAERVWDVFLAGIAPETGALGQFIRRNYPAVPWQTRDVRGTVTAAEAIAVPVELVLEPGRRQPPPRAITLTWRASIGGPQPSMVDFPLTIDFASVGEAPSGAGVVNADHDLNPLPVLRPRDGGPFMKPIAIDFGTSSTTIAIAFVEDETAAGLSEEQDLVLRNELADLLLAEGPNEPELEAEWSTLRGRWAETVGRAVRTPHKLTAAQLAEMLFSNDERNGIVTGQDEKRDELRDRLCAVLAPAVNTSDQLRTWLAGRLHQCFERTFDTLPVEALGLRLVRVDEDMTTSGEGYEIGSVASVVAAGRAAPDVHLGETRRRTHERDVVEVYPSLKRSLLAPAELAPEVSGLAWNPAPRPPVTTDFLLAHVYRRLIERAVGHDAELNKGVRRGVEQVLVTYPTTTPPVHRERLRKIITDNLGVPFANFTFDEGVAAAMFFLLRDLRGSVSDGIERYRSRSRRVAERPVTVWRRNLLVLDIGGGTTDAALLAIDLEDRTPDLPEPAKAGRFYLIRPQVLGSTGHPQLGGDLLTLRVFYWLKAQLADQLHKALPEPRLAELMHSWPGASQAADGGYRPLTPLLLRYQKPGVGNEDVIAALRELLPTHTPGASPGLLFRQLWSLAERLKVTIGRSDDPSDKAEPNPGDVQAFLRGAASRNSILLKDGIPDVQIVLTGADFEQLIRPVISRSAEIAADLVASRLRNERLDQVALSGKSNGMPLVKRIVTETLEKRFAEERQQHGTAASWDGEVVVEHRYAKQAASLGACWAQEQHGSLQGKGEAGENVRATLLKGVTRIDIDVDNLLLSLPCSFELHQGAGTAGLPLLAAGTPYSIGDRRGNLCVRSPWFELPRDARIRRVLGAGHTIEWGRFVFQEKADALRRSLGLDMPNEPPSDLYFQLQIDQSLNPLLFLTRGQVPFYVAHEAPHDLRPQLDSGWVDRNGWLEKQTTPIFAVPLADPIASAGPEQPPTAIFPTAPGGAPRFTTSIFELDPRSASIRVAIAETPLPGLAGAAEARDRLSGWRFEVPDRSGRHRELVTVAVPDGAYDPSVRYYASLDAAGRLRVHRGYPRYLVTTRLDEMLRHPGAVYRTAVDSGDHHLNADWNPFTGEH